MDAARQPQSLLPYAGHRNATRGRRGGGAVLTALGHDLIAHYRMIERAAAKVSATDLAALDAAQAPRKAALSGSGRAAANAAARRRSSLMPRRARS